MIEHLKLTREDLKKLGIEIPEHLPLFRSEEANKWLQDALHKAGIPGTIVIPLTLWTKRGIEYVEVEQLNLDVTEYVLKEYIYTEHIKKIKKNGGV